MLAYHVHKVQSERKYKKKHFELEPDSEYEQDDFVRLDD